VGDGARVLVGGKVVVTGEFSVAEKDWDEERVADEDRGVLVAGELLVVWKDWVFDTVAEC